MTCEGCKALARVKAGSQWAYFLCTAEKPAQIIERVPIRTKKHYAPVPRWCRYRKDKPL